MHITPFVKIIPLSFGVLFLSIFLCAVIYAWSEPGVAPVGGNINAPINTGASAQGKIGNLGVGVASPGTKLDVVGSIRATGDIYTTGAGLGSIINSNEGGNLSLTNNSKTGATANLWKIYNMTGGYNNGLAFWRYYANGVNAGPAMFLADDGNVGIGTSGPGAKLDVNGQIKISGGAPGAGKVLTSDAAGIASWQTPSAGATYSTLAGIPTRTAWSGIHRGLVAEQLSWKNYGNGHTVFDASNSTSPDGGAVNNTNAQIAWSASYPTLMGWNGANTYGVRVDSARISDSAGNSDTVDGWHRDDIRAWGNFTGIPGNIAYYDAWYGTSYLGSNGNLYMGWDGRWLSDTINQDVRNGASPQWGSTYANNWFRSQNATGWYSETYGGGIWMDQSTYVRVYGGKGFTVDGSVGIGISSPATKLHVDGVIAIGNNSSAISNTGKAIEMVTDTTFGGVHDEHSGVRMFAYDMNGWGTAKLGIQTSVNWGAYETSAIIGNDATSFTGSVSAPAFYYNSDASLKKNISPITDSLDKINKLNGVYFDWKNSNEHSVGLIAQDVEKVFPEAVSTNTENGIKSVDYGKMVAPLIEAVKSQQTEISDLKSQIKELNAKIDTLAK